MVVGVRLLPHTMVASSPPPRSTNVQVFHPPPASFGPQTIPVGSHPNPLGFISTLDRRRAEHRHLGWIYIMRNAAFREPLVKIGKSRRVPYQRAAELGAATAVPEGFQLLYFIHVSDRHRAETFVHEELAQYRKRASKEFFTVPLRVGSGRSTGQRRCFRY